jgi:hypothetical protein
MELICFNGIRLYRPWWKILVCLPKEWFLLKSVITVWRAASHFNSGRKKNSSTYLPYHCTVVVLVGSEGEGTP